MEFIKIIILSIYTSFLVSIIFEIISIFHKKSISKPLHDKELLNGIMDIAKKLKINFNSNEIYLLDGAKFKKAGIRQEGFNSSIFISTDYLQILSYEEILAAMAHEMVHIKKKHNLKSGFSYIFTLFFTLIISIYISNIISVLLLSFTFILFLILLSLIILSALRRKFEKDADICATKIIAPDSLIGALKKYNDLNKILKSHYTWLSTHPKFETRIKYLSELR